MKTPKVVPALGDRTVAVELTVVNAAIAEYAKKKA
jgi:hypothetical protein